jgi:hypothetical protein
MRPLQPLLLLACAVALFILPMVWGEGDNESKPGLLPAVAQGPKWLKGNLHTHSLWSDGDDFPEMIGDWYKRNGYQFLALTEHNVIAEKERWIDAKVDESNRGTALAKYLNRFGESWVERRVVDVKGKPTSQVRLKPFREFRSLLEEAGKFLLVPAEEITHKYVKAPVHMNGINLRDTIAPIDGASVEETMKVNLRQVADQSKRTGWPMLAFLNHPNFGWGVRAEDMVLVEELRFFELQNGHPTVYNRGDSTHAGCEKLWDIILALRLGKHNLAPLYGLATDDAHHYLDYGKSKANPGRAWVMVKAPVLTTEALLKAMQAGDFYCSTGVVLTDVRRDKNTLSVKIEAGAGITYKTRYYVTRTDTPLESKPAKDKDGKPITGTFDAGVGEMVLETDALESFYTLKANELYVRARVDSSKPQHNPGEPGDMERAWTQPLTPAKP